MKRNLLVYLLLLVAAFAGGVVMSSHFPTLAFSPEPGFEVARNDAGVESQAEPAADPGPDLLPVPSFAPLAKDLTPAVVNIFTTKVVKQGYSSFFHMPRRQFGEKDPFEDFFERFFEGPQREMKQRSLGSGFIISEDGYILTNNHVVEKADEIKVILSDKSRYDAKVVGKDPKTDIALIRIKAEGLPFARLGDSDRLEVGDWVVAIGNPFGLSHTVTAGIVSATGRVIGAGPYDDFIQTDASINFGNSGGPLLNVKGEVIGINTAIVAGGTGIGFATPINMARDFLPQLKEKGKVTRGWLGVLIQDLTPELADSMNLTVKEGALVSQVLEGGPADKAGIEVGDVIVEFDGKLVTSHHDLPALVAATPVGKKSKVKVVRGEKEKVFTVKIEELKDEKVAQIQGEEAEKSENFLGVEVENITPELAAELGAKDQNGVVVTGVEQGSLAAEAGVRRGDVIREVNRKPIRNRSDFLSQLAKTEKKKSALLLVERGGQAFFVVIEGGRER